MKNDWLAQGCDHGTVVLSLDSEGQALVLCVVCHTSWTVPLSTPVSEIVRDVFTAVDQ